MTFDIEAAIEAGRAWAKVQAEAEHHGLILVLRDVVDDPDTVRKAWAALEADTPLLDHYPNGDPARPPYTARQVLLLANIEFLVIDHDTKEYQDAIVRIRAELGRHPPRVCQASTRTGAKCRSYALAYSDVPVCTNHASEGMRGHNREMLNREEEELKKALRAIGLDVASKKRNSP